MMITAEWTAVILSLIVAVCGVLGWLLQSLRLEIGELKRTLAEDVANQAIHIDRLDERLRLHVENEVRHTNETARADLHQRLRRIEDLLEKLFLNK